MLEFIILGTLFSQNLSGYDIRKCIENGIGMFYKASYGSVYPILAKLTNKGFVTCNEDSQDGRKKKIYQITEEGRLSFMEWLQKDESQDSIEAFMARVFFFDKLPEEVSKKKIQKYEYYLEEYEESLLEQRKKYMDLPNREDYFYKISTLYFGICKLQSMIKWCRVARKKEELENLIDKDI